MFKKKTKTSKNKSDLNSQITTDRLVKIWFSKRDQHWLGGPLNEYRLSLHRALFPNDNITLISNYDTFSSDNQQALQAFCQKNHISLVNLNTIKEKISQSTTISDKDVQLQLLKIAEDEINLPSGSLASASDIIRILSPALDLGIYADFDLIKKKAQKLNAPLGVLFDGHFFYDNKTEQMKIESVSNQIFYGNEKKTKFFKIYRKKILDNYQDFNTILQDIIDALKDKKNMFKCDTDTIQYKAALTHLIKNNENYIKQDLCQALSYRDAMRLNLSAENFKNFLEQSVIEISGPNCMHEAINEFLANEFIPFCKKNNKFEEKMIEEFIGLRFKIDDCFINEDDGMWLSSDKFNKNFEKLEQSAVILQSFVRKRAAQLTFKALQKKTNTPTTTHNKLTNNGAT